VWETTSFTECFNSLACLLAPPQSEPAPVRHTEECPGVPSYVGAQVRDAAGEGTGAADAEGSSTGGVPPGRRGAGGPPGAGPLGVRNSAQGRRRGKLPRRAAEGGTSCGW